VSRSVPLRSIVQSFVVCALSLIAHKARGGDAVSPSIDDLKDLYHCTERGVLCVDSCTGDIFAKHDGETATFYADQGTLLRVQVVGYCHDNPNTTTFTANVTYRPNIDSATKTVPPLAPGGVRASNEGQPAAVSSLDTTIALAGQSSDHIAEITVTRQTTPSSDAAPIAVPGAQTAQTRYWRTAHASYILNHGRYYVDFGAGLAIVAKGTRTVAAVPYRGDANDLRLATETSTPLTPLFSAFVYPLGHRRDSLSPFFSGPLPDSLRDLWVIHLGTELTRENLLRSVYLGTGLEVVSGVNFVIGGAFVPVTTYRSGAAPGMIVQSASDVGGVTRQVEVFRFYAAVSVSTEIFNSARTAYTTIR
jgi:hypothetical protein